MIHGEVLKLFFQGVTRDHLSLKVISFRTVSSLKEEKLESENSHGSITVDQEVVLWS